MSSAEGEDAGNLGPLRTGLSVQDFSSQGNWPAVKRALAMLPPRQRRRLILAAGAQVALNLLDLLGILLIGVVASVAAAQVAGAGTLPPTVSGIVDRLGLGDVSVTRISVFLAVAAVAVLVFKTLLQALLARRMFRFLANRQAEVSAQLSRRFLSQPLLFVQRWTTSEAIYALGGGVGAATVALLGAAITILAEVSLFAIVLVTLLLIDPFVTLGALAIFAVVIGLTYRSIGRRTERNARTLAEGSIDTLSAVSEALQTYRETTVMGRRGFYIDRYSRIIGGVARATASNSFIMEVPKYVLESTLYVAVLLLGLVQFLVDQNLTSAAGTVAVFLAAGMRVVPALLRLQGAVITIRNAAVAAQPTFFMADALDHQDVEGRSQENGRVALTTIRERFAHGHEGFDAHISVRGITFTYMDAQEPALVDASLEAPAGSSVALVGSTGAGKSTLADIILGVIEPDSGSALIGGMTPREAIAEWPGAISYVPQAVALVPGSVRLNVALGLPVEAIDDDLVWEALERASMADFLRSAREGLDTSIGERGVRLSGGQRQRLGIARALYTRPRLLVLDEATSALDAETEVAIVRTLDALEGDVTTVTVAHRLATVRRADQLLYLKDGRIESRGTFEEVRSTVPDFDRQASLLGL